MIYYGISIFAIVGKFRNWTMGIKVEDKIFIKEGKWTEFWVRICFTMLGSNYVIEFDDQIFKFDWGK